MSVRELAYQNPFRFVRGVRSAYFDFTARRLDVDLVCRQSWSIDASSRRNGRMDKFSRPG